MNEVQAQQASRAAGLSLSRQTDGSWVIDCPRCEGSGIFRNNAADCFACLGYGRFDLEKAKEWKERHSSNPRVKEAQKTKMKKVLEILSALAGETVADDALTQIERDLREFASPPTRQNRTFMLEIADRLARARS